MKKLLFLLLLPLLLTVTGCRDYVEIDVSTGNERILRYTSDFQALLNDRSTFEPTAAILPMLTSDDVDAKADVTTQNRLLNELGNIYTWAADFYTTDQSDAAWDQLYNQIYVCNEVITKVMASERGTDDVKQKVLAEAKVQRAYAYLTLVNLYAPIYQSGQAATIPGVPFPLTPDLFQLLTRVPLATIYDRIITDLTDAIPHLLTTPAYNTHPGKAAAYALLARIYLYRQEFGKADENARQALAIQNTLVNLGPLEATPTNYPRSILNPEVILLKSGGSNLTLPLNPDLLNLFDPNDLRYKIFTRVGTSFFPSIIGRGFYKSRLTADAYNVNVGPTVGEMMLVRAEVLARAGQPGQAVQLLNDLRSKRFQASTYKALEATTPSQALTLVLQERQRELMGTGLRWFDQRRFSLEPALATTITRTFKNSTYTLAPGSPRFVYPIGPKYIQFNPEIQQNVR